MEPFEHYELLEEIGRGGMGVVYRARDTRMQREVAVKMLPRDGSAFRERFEREIRAVTRLEHNAIVPIYDFGEREGRPFVVMRYMSGGALDERITRGPMDLDEVHAIIERVASALDAAHESALVHRDVKPANILFDRYGTAFLTDFGIVKEWGAVTTITEAGRTVGTPSYMAPEMAQTGDVSPAVDIYALGVTIYQMLTGYLPFIAPTPMAVMMAHIHYPVPNVLTERPELPQDVQTIILRCMAKAPVHRYQTAGEVAEDLRALVEGVRLPPPPKAITDAMETLEKTRASLAPPEQEDPPPPERPAQRSGFGAAVAGAGAGVLVVLLILAIVAALTVPRVDELMAQVAALVEVPTPVILDTPTPQPTITPPEPEVVIVTGTPEPSPTPTERVDFPEEEVRSAVEAYDEGVQYLLQTLDESQIAEVARGEALRNRLNAVNVLSQAGGCTWRYEHRGLYIREVTFLDETQAEVIALVDRDGTVFCDEEELTEYAFTGPTTTRYIVTRFEDGWYVTESDPIFEEEEGATAP